MNPLHDLVFVAVALVAGTLALAAWPRLLLSVFKRAILSKGFEGRGPVPVNSLYVQSEELFADPLASATASRLMTTGVNRDTLLLGGWLELVDGALLLRVPDAGERYYSLQLTDPATNTNVAYIGTRTTGNRAGVFVLAGPRWTASVPGAVVIRAPGNAVLMIGRVLVADEEDLPAAHAFAASVTLDPVG